MFQCLCYKREMGVNGKKTLFFLIYEPFCKSRAIQGTKVMKMVLVLW